MNDRTCLVQPRVSIVMPVYNGERYVREAIDSVLNQTFRDFEFVIVNDGSTDRTSEVIRSYDDTRIRRFDQENRGLVAALNRGVNEARAELVARQDADDISEPSRLERQVVFLDQNPQVALLGSSYELIGPGGGALRTEFMPVRDIDVRREILVRNPFGHGTVMMRKHAFQEAGGYRGEFRHNEDLDLWRRIVAAHQVANLPEVLYRWRVHPEGISQRNERTQMIEAGRIFDSLRRAPLSPPLTAGEILRGSRYYRTLSGESQPGRHRQYLAAQYRLSLALIRRGRLDAGVPTLLAGIIADPRVALRSIGRALKRSARVLRPNGTTPRS